MFRKRTPPSPTPSRSARSSTKIDSLVSVVEQKYANSALKTKDEIVNVAPKTSDPIVENIVFLREEMANDDNFYEFLDQFSKLTDHIVSYEEYQNSVKSLVPPHLLWRVNSLIKSILDTVVEPNPSSPVKISRELKLPSISELLENCTISTPVPERNFYPESKAPSPQALAYQQLIGGYMANFAVASDEEIAERPVKTPRNSLEQHGITTPRNSLEQHAITTPRGSLEQISTPRNSIEKTTTPRNSLEQHVVTTPRNSIEQHAITTPRGSLEQISSPHNSLEQRTSMEQIPPLSPEESEDASDDDEFSEKKKKKSRVRNEWTTEEDKVFLEGLKTYGLDFSAIAKMLPSRSRYQIRTHYAYLAKSIRANEKSNQNGEVPYRRLKTRGRPPKGGAVNAMPNELLAEITECVRNLEMNQKKLEQEQTSSRGSI